MDFKSGSPNNCTNSSSTSCYRWKSAIDLEMTVDKFGPSDLCISIRWRTQLFDPVVKDCFLIDNQYGRWFGGFGGAASFPIGKHVPSTLYLPGESFGEMADRLWLSTNGVAVVAEADFPLYLEVRKDNSGSSRELCVSSWYGYASGVRRMDYSICRSASTSQVHQLDRKSTRLNSSHVRTSRMPSSA